MRVAAVLLLAAAACASLTGPTVVRWVEAPAAKRERVSATLERRDACLKPPYTLEPGKAIVLSGLRIEERNDGPREMTFTTVAGGAALDPDGVLELEKRDEAELRAIDGVESVGLSGCVTGSRPRPCISLGVRLCEQPLDALAESLHQVIANDGLARGQTVTFHVALTGAVGPRCEADEPSCRPEPYEAAEYRPSERRGLVQPRTDDAEPQCTWDGECKKSGCGNACAVWTEAHQVGRCGDRPELKDALCGCVEHRCAWFVQ